MKQGHSVDDYNRYVKRKLFGRNKSKAMAKSIGGNFIPFGLIMRDLLLQYGLGPSSVIVDVGCGSGRLANALKEMPELKYVGIDVVKELLDYAEELCGRDDWQFRKSTDFTIPMPDGSVDVVTAFSVFTHLLHEETFVYLQEARRVLKPGGKIIFSFLDFSVPQHWAVFETNIRHIHKRPHLNQFMDPQAIKVWCQYLKLDVLDVLPGNEKRIVLRQPVKLEDGTVEEAFGALGQSIGVLQKPEGGEHAPLYTPAPPGFDAELYLQANPDVAEAGVDALEHFLSHGQFEGRKLKP